MTYKSHLNKVRLLQIMAFRNVTSRDLARMAGCTEGNISKILNDPSKPLTRVGVSVVAGIARGLGMICEDLIVSTPYPWLRFDQSDIGAHQRFLEPLCHARSFLSFSRLMDSFHLPYEMSMHLKHAELRKTDLDAEAKRHYSNLHYECAALRRRVRETHDNFQTILGPETILNVKAPWLHEIQDNVLKYGETTRFGFIDGHQWSEFETAVGRHTGIHNWTRINIADDLTAIVWSGLEMHHSSHQDTVRPLRDMILHEAAQRVAHDFVPGHARPELARMRRLGVATASFVERYLSASERGIPSPKSRNRH